MDGCTTVTVLGQIKCWGAKLIILLAERANTLYDLL